MKKANTIDIFGTTYTIIIEKDLVRSGIIGNCDKLKKVIMLDDSLKGDDYWSTLLHEIFHAVFHELSFIQAISPDLEEVVIDNLANAVVKNYKLTRKPRK